MKTTQNTPQSSASGSIFSAACLQLARMNPAAFAKRPKLEALAAIRAAIAERPGNIAATPTARCAAARKAATGRGLADKLEAASYWYPALFTEHLAAIGLADRVAVVKMLRAYNRAAWHLDRQEQLKAVTKAKRAALQAELEAAAQQAELDNEVLERAEQRRLEKKARSIAKVAANAARPQRGLTSEENARNAAGYAFLKANGAYD